MTTEKSTAEADRIAALPKWAQGMIQNLRMKVEEERAHARKIAGEPGSPNLLRYRYASLGAHGADDRDDGIRFDDDVRAEFRLGTGHVSIRLADRGISYERLVIYGVEGNALSVLPESCNVCNVVFRRR